jgi:hypothetical protein
VKREPLLRILENSTIIFCPFTTVAHVNFKSLKRCPGYPN